MQLLYYITCVSKTKINVLSCGMRMWAQLSFVLSQITHLTDRRTALSWLDHAAGMVHANSVQQTRRPNVRRWSTQAYRFWADAMYEWKLPKHEGSGDSWCYCCIRGQWMGGCITCRGCWSRFTGHPSPLSTCCQPCLLPGIVPSRDKRNGARCSCTRQVTSRKLSTVAIT